MLRSIKRIRPWDPQATEAIDPASKRTATVPTMPTSLGRFTADQIQQMVTLRDGGATLRQIGRMFGVTGAYVGMLIQKWLTATHGAGQSS